MSFVPQSFEPPRIVQLGDFRLEVLRPALAVEDFEAVTTSESQISRAYGPKNWWSEGLSFEANLDDLARHEREFNDRAAFAYALRTDGQYLGCVYIRPTSATLATIYQAHVYFWLASAQTLLTDDEALAALSAWLAAEWPFAATVFPGRTVSWSAWDALA